LILNQSFESLQGHIFCVRDFCFKWHFLFMTNFNITLYSFRFLFIYYFRKKIVSNYLLF
jgi:hypothetical protein